MKSLIEHLNKHAWQKSLLVIICLLFCNLLFFHNLWLGEALTGKDTLTFSLPYAHILHQALARGELPLWSSLLNFPAHAESQGAFLYPPHLLVYWLFDDAQGYNLTIIMHMLWMSLGMYLWARYRKLGRLGAFLASLCFTYGSFIILRININNFFNNAAWVPWLLLCAEQAGEKPGPGRTSLLGIVTGMILFTGHFQITSYALLVAFFLGLYSGFKESKQRNVLKIIMSVGGGMALGVLLALPQLLPTLELIGLSNRAAQGYSSLTDYSLFPPQMTTLLLPGLFGRAEHPSIYSYASINSYWGQGSFWELTLYYGAVACVLALAASLCKGQRRYALFGIVFLVLALGRYLPGYSLLVNLPPFSLFRIPARLGFITILMGSLLAGAGLNSITRGSLKVAKRTIRLLLIAIGLSIVLLLALNLLGASRLSSFAESKGLSDAGKAERASFLTNAIDKSISPVNPDNLVPILALLLAILLLWMMRKHFQPVIIATLLAMISFVELFFFGYGYNHSTSDPIYQQPPPAAKALQQMDAERVFSSGWDISPGEEINGYDMLHPNSPASWKLAIPFPRGSLLPANSVQLQTLVEDSMTTEGDGSYPYREKRSASQADSIGALQLSGVQYLVRHHPLTAPGLEETTQSDGMIIYRVTNALPHLYLADKYEVEPDRTKAMELAIAGLDAGKNPAVLEKQLGTTSPGEGSIQIDQATDCQLSIKVVTNSPQLLVINDLYYPGWHAFVDGVEQEIAQANGWARAIHVESGKHDVLLRFEPTGWKAGLAGAGIAALALIILGFWEWRRRKPGNS